MGEFGAGHRGEITGGVGAAVTFKGTVSDFDCAGMFGLILADDGRFLPFNLRGTPIALRSRIEVGARVMVTQHLSDPAARAVDLALIDG